MLSTEQSAKIEKVTRFDIPDSNGRFGPYGGSFVPETLSYPLQELNEAYESAKSDPSFREELSRLLKEFAGRPTELYFAERLTSKLGELRFSLNEKIYCILELTK